MPSAVHAGINLVLQVYDDVSQSYLTVGGLRTKKFTIGNAAIDITNHGSNEWKELLDGHGERQVKVSGAGVYDDSSGMLTYLAQLALNGPLHRWQLIDSDVGGHTWQGQFKLLQFEYGGDHNKEVTWTLSLESSGVVNLIS